MSLFAFLVHKDRHRYFKFIFTVSQMCYNLSMKEIELKARVSDPDALAQRLNKIAVFQKKCIRDDKYFSNKKAKCRIRKETIDNSIRYIFTYKQKESTQTADGKTIEVNEEKETILESGLPLEDFLKDAGFQITLTKHKEVSHWTMALDAGDPLPQKSEATFELCLVPPLGYFLEIEILSPADDANTVSRTQEKLLELLDMTGLERKQIENRYYSQMLREIQNKGVKDV